MEKRKTTNRFQRRRTLRLTAGEDEKLIRQAATAGLSVSEYMRRLFFGGRPIIARTDELKHHLTDIRATGRAESLEEVNRTLQSIRRTIEALSGTV